jgi:hypothetical protein
METGRGGSAGLNAAVSAGDSDGRAGGGWCCDVCGCGAGADTGDCDVWDEDA